MVEQGAMNVQCNEKFQIDIREMFSIMRVIKYWRILERLWKACSGICLDLNWTSY